MGRVHGAVLVVALAIAPAAARPDFGPGTPGPRKSAQVKVQPIGGELGGRTTDDVMRQLKRPLPLFRACYQRERNFDPKLEGTLVMQFELDNQGQHVKARIVDGTARHPKLEVCVLKQIRHAKFLPTGKSASITLPLVFFIGVEP